MVLLKVGTERPFSPYFTKSRSDISELSFMRKDLGFVQTRDQELPIALFKSIKLRLPKKLELVYIF